MGILPAIRILLSLLGFGRHDRVQSAAGAETSAFHGDPIPSDGARLVRTDSIAFLIDSSHIKLRLRMSAFRRPLDPAQSAARVAWDSVSGEAHDSGVERRRDKPRFRRALIKGERAFGIAPHPQAPPEHMGDISLRRHVAPPRQRQPQREGFLIIPRIVSLETLREGRFLARPRRRQRPRAQKSDQKRRRQMSHGFCQQTLSSILNIRVHSIIRWGMDARDPIESVLAAHEPFSLLSRWMEEAAARGEALPDAISLATADAEARPNIRMVLLKGADETGFLFYTGMESVKAREMRENPRAALCLYWKSLRRQIRARGDVAPLGDDEADAYFRTRARASQIGAWASDQSAPLSDRALLEARFRDYEDRFGEGAVPRPEKWSGFRLVPDEVEFWIDRPSRLHDRVVFSRGGRGRRGRKSESDFWRKSFLQP